MDAEQLKYQEDISSRGSEILKKYGILYLSMEMRTGKTITAFMTADKSQKKHVLFIARKKAIKRTGNRAA